MEENSTAIYLYCFAKSELLGTFEESGIDGSPIFIRTAREIAAVLSVVSIEEFSGPEAEARMQDLAWVGPRALRHQELIEQVMHHSPVFPARFGTLFTSYERLEGMIETHYGAIWNFLEKCEDKEEWALKAYLNREKATERLISARLENRNGHHGLSPGAMYLQERRIKASAEKDLSTWVNGVCKGLWKDLVDLAPDFLERKVLPAGTTETEGDMVVNWAFLVPRKNLEAFLSITREASNRHMESGLSFQTSGPWPPYSFAPALGTVDQDQ